MGYWEVCCQLCGVSFNLNRIRSKDEPRSAAFGSGRKDGWIEGRNFTADEEKRRNEGKKREFESNEEDHGCSSATGCCMVFRPSLSGTFLPEPLLYENDPESGDLTGDPDYEYQSDSDYEPLEYDSDGSDEDGDATPAEKESADERKWTFKVSGPDHPEYDTEFLPLTTPLDDMLYYQIDPQTFRMNVEAHHKARCFEHIAGPDCQNRQGYLGKHISVEEMRGCHTVQCILPKRQEWEPRPDDLEFERESQYILTGVANHMPSSGSDLMFAPVRYGIDNISAETEFVLETTQEELREIGLPFHPTCFEIFIQATQKSLGYVDIDTLVQIRDKACLEREDFPIQHHQHVTAGQGQCWDHIVGHEYLAANPIFLPALKPIMESAASNNDHFSIQSSPFEVRHRSTALSSVQDPFLAFPRELIEGIVNNLSSADIATLRLSSRAFTHLPISLWHRLVVEEMPWLYEAWSSKTEPYYWATVIAEDLHKEKQAREEFNHYLKDQRAIINEDMPEVYSRWVNGEPKWEWPEHPDGQDVLDLSPVKLAHDTTNWYQLYRGITVHWDRLKGLQNRARIWDAVTQIIDTMKEAHVKRGIDGEV